MSARVWMSGVRVLFRARARSFVRWIVLMVAARILFLANNFFAVQPLNWRFLEKLVWSVQHSHREATLGVFAV